MDNNETVVNKQGKQKLIEGIDKFTKNVDSILMETCTILGWNLEKTVQKKEPYVTCPFNQSHQVPERTIEKHLQKCEWKTLGYTDECIPLPESTLPLDSPYAIKIDMTLQHQILQEAKQKNPDLNISLDEKFTPKTSDRYFSDFTSDEKVAIYDYVIANTASLDAGENIATDIHNPDKTKEKELSIAIVELLAAERNLKRRRAKYRGVHTNKKSHVEIMKEVIEQQMEMWREHTSEKYHIPNPDLSNEDEFSSNLKIEKRKIERNKYDTSDGQSHSDKDTKYSKSSSFKPERNFKQNDEDYLNKKQSSHHNDSKEFSKFKYQKSEFNNFREGDFVNKKYNSYDKNRNSYNDQPRDSNKGFKSDYGNDKDRYKNDYKREKSRDKSYSKKRNSDESNKQTDRSCSQNDHCSDSIREKRDYQNFKNRHKHKLVSDESSKSNSRDNDDRNSDSKKKHQKHKSSRKHKRSRSKSREKHKKSKHK